MYKCRGSRYDAYANYHGLDAHVYHISKHIVNANGLCIMHLHMSTSMHSSYVLLRRHMLEGLYLYLYLILPLIRLITPHENNSH